ncbi:predicted protein [Uncinocarpus reesii 1704]|uniref:Uncharacterized protein n=1 Tax=Uncinocarpus reesii (strain UAMH 1704) TaxID=336963 RepID=C4JLZ8_UNCRE|nr:uncharacterized protein UREG_03856 [Uncinocarpus reesii 1704]EEP79010.1 predicted protein [Uncinocarpus reesii 1704]
MVDYRSPALQAPHRKPLPAGNAGLQFYSADASTPQQSLPLRVHNSPANSQHRPRTASSSFLPSSMHPLRQMTPVYPPQQHPQQHPQQQYSVPFPSRRPSNATVSTTSTGGNPHPSRHMSASQNNVRRSSSGRTASSQVGYVALMRRQKATVWCDRSQTEDPREAHQRRVAKQRAILEVQGGGGSGRTSTLISSGKIRHSSATKASPFTTGTMVGAGVPLRLSANEIGNADDDLDNQDGSTYHRRTGSGRSSAGSNRLQRPNQPRLSIGSAGTPPNAEPAESRFDIPDIVETPAAETAGELKSPVLGKDHAGAGFQGGSASDNNARPGTALSNTSEREEDFGMITEMKAPSGAAAAARRYKAAEELKRRGSVDDRTTTLGNVRLFVANPDLSD